MIEFFFMMPWYYSVALVIFTAVALALIGFYCVHKLVDGQKLREDQEITSYALNTISLFYCLLVGLVVVDVQSEHNAIQDNVIKEASILVDMYHLSKAFAPIDQVPIATAIEIYAKNVMAKELPLMREGKDYALVRYVHPDELWASISKIKPQDYRELALYQNLLDRMNQLTHTRFERFTSVEGRTSTFMWIILIYGGIIVIACSLMFSSKSKISHAIHLGFNVSLISMILLLLYALDAPFAGPTAVPLSAFQEVLDTIQAIHT
jgi:hypothetical protein